MSPYCDPRKKRQVTTPQKEESHCSKKKKKKNVSLVNGPRGKQPHHFRVRKRPTFAFVIDVFIVFDGHLGSELSTTIDITGNRRFE